MSPTLLQLGLGALLWALLTFALWRQRRWLVFYVTGAFGFILLVLVAAVVLDWDTTLEAVQAGQVAAMAGVLGIDVDLMGATGLAIPNHTGWAVFDIGIECSALLEMSAIIGLTIFYPAFSGGRKAWTAAFGTGVTYAINLLRILLIVAIVNAFGTSWVFSAHAVFGRVFFFVGTVALYWYIITRPTVAYVTAQVREGADG